MAKVKINWPPMSMKAEGEDAAVLAQAEQFLKYVKEAHKISFDVLPTIFRDGCRDPEEGVGEPECVGCNDDCESCETYEKANSVKPLTEPEEVAPGAQWDVVAIYDNAGIEEPEIIDMSMVICTYQTPARSKEEIEKLKKAPALLDLYNIMQDISQHFKVYNVFGDYFNVLMPITCVIQQDDTKPYYFSTVQMDVTGPSMSRENNPEVEALT